MFMKTFRINWVLGAIGLVTGVISYFLSKQFGDLHYTAGVVFGLGITLYFLVARDSHPTWIWKLPLFILVSTFSYYSAVFVTIKLDSIINHANFFVGGLVGAAVLLFGVHLLFTHVTLNEFGALVLLGGVLGLSFFLGTPGNIDNQLLILYVVWQAGMAIGLGHVLDKN